MMRLVTTTALACCVLSLAVAQTPANSVNNLACPQSPFWFPTNRTEPLCTRDADCQPGERCCLWTSGTQHCLEGIDTTIRQVAGSCPQFPADRRNCIADFPGCRFDSECGANQKCCRNEACRYSECSNVEAVERNPTEPPRECTEIGCGGSPVPSNCRNVRETRPNGEGCEPVCRVCDDPPTTTTTRPLVPRSCTERGCGRPAAGPGCQRVRRFRPNGPGCPPICTVCDDPPTTLRTPACTCPPGTPATAGCRRVREETLIGCNLVCRTCLDLPSVENLACPVSPFWFDTERSEPLCEVDTDCRAGEKCCFWSSSKHCLRGIDTTPKSGSCPPSPSAGPRNCIADFGGCRHDSECDGVDKCCRNEACGYSECRSPQPAPQRTDACSLTPCGPEPAAGCRNIRLVRPNGGDCPPVCRVCADITTTERVEQPRCRPGWVLECQPRSRGSLQRSYWFNHFWPCRYVWKTNC